MKFSLILKIVRFCRRRISGDLMRRANVRMLYPSFLSLSSASFISQPQLSMQKQLLAVEHDFEVCKNDNDVWATTIQEHETFWWNWRTEKYGDFPWTSYLVAQAVFSSSPAAIRTWTRSMKRYALRPGSTAHPLSPPSLVIHRPQSIAFLRPIAPLAEALPIAFLRSLFSEGYLLSLWSSDYVPLIIYSSLCIGFPLFAAAAVCFPAPCPQKRKHRRTFFLWRSFLCGLPFVSSCGFRSSLGLFSATGVELEIQTI